MNAARQPAAGGPPGRPPRELEELLAGALPELGLPADPARITALLRFVALLAKWNRAYNLTSIRDEREMVIRHVLDSLSALPFLAGQRLLDVGTGAGLPGIPLALFQPERQFTLLDSVGKKLRFVQHAAAELNLANVEVVQARVQQFQPVALFDTITCRAFSALADFVRGCGRLLAPGGRLLAMKGQHPEAEIALLPGDWRVAEVTPLQVPLLEAARHMVVIQRRQEA